MGKILLVILGILFGTQCLKIDIPKSITRMFFVMPFPSMRSYSYGLSRKRIKIHWLLPDKFQGPTSYVENGRVQKGTLSVSINHSLIMSQSPGECHRDEGIQQQRPKDGTHRIALKDASRDGQPRRGLYMHRVFLENGD